MAKKPASKQDEKNNKEAFLKAAKGASKTWAKARKVDPGESMGQPEMEDGQYIAHHHKFTYGAKDGKAWASWTFNVAEGDNKGDKPNKFYALDRDVSMEQLSKDLQRGGFDIADLELADLPGIADELNDADPKATFKITVKNNEGTGKDKKGKKVTKKYLNLYVDKVIEDYEAEESDDEEDGEEDDTEETSEIEKGSTVTHKPKGAKKPLTYTVIKVGDDTLDLKDEEGNKLKGVPTDKCELVEDEEEDEDEDEEEDDKEDEEDEDEDPEKGNAVSYKAKGKKKATEWTVTKVDAKKRTCSLKNEDGDKVDGVSFDDVELVFEEDDEE